MEIANKTKKETFIKGQNTVMSLLAVPRKRWLTADTSLFFTRGFLVEFPRPRKY